MKERLAKVAMKMDMELRRHLQEKAEKQLEKERNAEPDRDAPPVPQPAVILKPAPAAAAAAAAAAPVPALAPLAPVRPAPLQFVPNLPGFEERRMWREDPACVRIFAWLLMTSWLGYAAVKRNGVFLLLVARNY